MRFWALLVVLATLAFAGASYDDAGTSSREHASRIVDAQSELAAMRALRPSGVDTCKVSGVRRSPSRAVRAVDPFDVHTTLGLRAARRASVPAERRREASMPDHARRRSMVLLN
ncbi:MAG: hypothetical protein JWP87_2983 [Labilithrix sp.]|nr:hypothetical protein [Labilithrix sp.]